MIIKVTKGSNPHQLASYLLHPNKQKAGSTLQIDTNMVGLTVAEFAEEFRFSHALNPRVKQTMAHYSVSLAPNERVKPEIRHDISRRILTETGHSDCQYLSVEHHDQSHKHNVQHWHIATSTVDLDGQHIEDDFIRLKLRRLERCLEQEFGLTATQVKPETERKNLTTGEHRLKGRTHQTLPKENLWSAIDAAARDQPSMSLLVARLRAQSISVRLRLNGGRPTGISYELGGIAFPGYKLGKAYSFNGLQRHLGVYYLPEQDPHLLELTQLSPQENQHRLERYQTNQQRYEAHYQRYCPPVDTTLTQRDLFVVRQALADNVDLDTVAAIISWASEQAQLIKRTQGAQAAAEYAMQLTAEEVQRGQQWRQLPREQHQGLER